MSQNSLIFYKIGHYENITVSFNYEFKNYRLESKNSFYQAMTSRIYHMAALIYGNFIYNKKPTFDISAFIHLTFKVYIRK